MRIESVHIENFKRFTDLRIEGMPSTAKLVVAFVRMDVVNLLY